MPEEPIKSIKEIAEPIISQADMFLVDIEVKHSKLMEIWVLVDSETNGVNLDSCSKISRQLGFELEEKGVIDSAYRLNVSSPGLSRALSDQRQYGKNVGRTAKTKYKSGNDYLTVEGLLEKVEKQTFVIKQDDGQLTEIDFSDVVETKIIPKI
jgi:ribosome maturation factor RimP